MHMCHDEPLAVYAPDVLPVAATGRRTMTPEFLDRFRDEVRDVVIEADRADCSSADCIADAVYERLRVAGHGYSLVPTADLDRLRAAPLDVKRLADAIWDVMYPGQAAREAVGQAPDIAARYAALGDRAAEEPDYKRLDDEAKASILAHAGAEGPIIDVMKRLQPSLGDRAAEEPRYWRCPRCEGRGCDFCGFSGNVVGDRAAEELAAAQGPDNYRYPSDYCSEPTHRALTAHSVQSLDSLLIAEAPLLRDAYLAYALRNVQAEVAALMFGAVDDEVFERVVRALGAEGDRAAEGLHQHDSAIVRERFSHGDRAAEEGR